MSQEPLSACFSSSKGLVAMAASDGNIVIWHAINCQVTNTIQGPPQVILGVCFSVEGNLMSCAYQDKVIIWDITIIGGSRLQQLDTEAICTSNLAFSQDGNILLGYSPGGGIIVWNWRTRKQLFQLSRGSLLKNAFLSDKGSCLVVCTSDAKIATIDLSTRNMYGGINLQDCMQKFQNQQECRQSSRLQNPEEAGVKLQIPGTSKPLSISQELVDIMVQDQQVEDSLEVSPKVCENNPNMGGSLPTQIQDPVQVNFRAMPPTLNRQVWCMADFEVIRKIYKGKNSTILHVKDRVSGLPMAIKSYDVSRLTLIEQTQVAREVRLHSNLTHPNVIRLFAAWLEGKYLNLVMEFAIKGDLYMFQRTCRGGVLQEDIAVHLILKPLLSALTDLHANGLIHRDLKPENILFDDEYLVKLCDFGLSINSRQETPNTRLGTVDYVAPEILDCPVKVHPFQYKSNPPSMYTSKVDVWALGVLVYELLVGVPPFEGNSDMVTLSNIKSKNVSVPPHVSLLARQFILQCLDKNPQTRPSVDALQLHPWIQYYSGIQVPNPIILASMATMKTSSPSTHHEAIDSLEQGWYIPPSSNRSSVKSARNLLKIPGVTAL